MAHAFISYVRENSEIVDCLASELRSRGIEVWLDRDDIKPGVYWKDAIKKAIQEGAFFIACYSKELNDRRETYMHGELGIAIDRLRQMPRNRVWFIPVFLNETDIPYHPISDRESLKDLHTTPLFKNWNGGIMKILGAMKLDDPINRRVMHLSDLIRYHPTERHYASQQLAEIGPAAADAVPALTEALRDSDTDVCRSAVEKALGKIGPAAVPALTEALRDSDAWVRRSAAGVLGGIGPAAADAVPTLTEALRDSDADVRWGAAKALGKIGPAAADAVPALTEALRDSDADVRRSAVETLAEIGPAAADAVPALRTLRDYYYDGWTHSDMARAEYALEKIRSRPRWLRD